MKNLNYDLDGYIGKNIKVYDDKCIISCKPTFGAMLTNSAADGAKTIYYSDVTGIQFKEATAFRAGYLQLETSSGNIRQGKTPFTDENSFSYNRGDVQNEMMEEVFSFIQERVEYYKTMKNNPAIVAAISPAEEVKKMKELLDMGIITQAEFIAKKKQLLGL